MTDWSSSITGATLRPGLGAVLVPGGIEAAEDFAAAEVVGYINGDGKLAKADADAAATATGVLALRVAGAEKTADGSCDAGEIVSAVVFGPVSGLTGLDETKPYYLSGTAGKGADAAGTVTRALGNPISGTEFLFAPSVTPSS